MVEAVFPLDDLNDSRSRIKNLNKYQLCVKNPNVIKKIEDYTGQCDYESLNLKLKDFEDYRRKQRKNIYKTRIR